MENRKCSSVCDILKCLKYPSAAELKDDSPGIIYGIWCGNKEIKVEACGQANVITHEHMDKKFHMRIGSITKTFTSTIILKLAELNLLNLNDYAYTKISPFLPWYNKLPKNITILQLGNMTSGLFNYTEDSLFAKELDTDPKKEWDPVDLVGIALDHESYFEAGQGWYYSNTNYILLGIIAEYVTSKPIKQLYQEIIFDPLRLDKTSIPGDVFIPEPHPRGYMYGYIGPKIPLTVFRDVTSYYNPSFASYAGYIISTLNDLKRFAQPFVNGDLIGPKMTKIRDKTYVSTRFGEYGFGIARLKSSTMSSLSWYGHDGSIPGFNSSMLYNPEYDITVIVLNNLQSRILGIGPAVLVESEIIDIIGKAVCKWDRKCGRKC